MTADRTELDADIEVFVVAALGGDQRGFTGLYRALGGRVAGYLRSRGVGEVDDVVNEVFLAAFENLRSFDGDGARFRSWLFGIAWNKSSDWHRRAARSPLTAEIPDSALEALKGGNAEEDATDRLSDGDVEEMLDGLTDDQRDVLMLRVVAGLSLCETAEALEKPVGAIKSLQHRALASVNRKISHEAVSSTADVANTGVR